MPTTQYIGSRYVPLFADPMDWSSAKEYEALTIVTHEGNSYTSKQFVPVGIDIDNENYWAETGNYNAQVEQYRRDVLDYKNDVEEYHNELESINTKIDNLESDVLKQYLAEAQFEVEVRSLVEGVASAQGFCIFGANNRYCAIATPTTDDASGYLNIYDTDNNTLISRTEIGMGHANTLSYLNGIILVYNTNNDTAMFINVNDVLHPTVTRTVDLSSLNLGIRTICWLSNDVILGCSYLNSTFNLYEINASSGALMASHTNVYINYGNLVNQGIATDEDYIYLCMSTPNTIVKLDKTNYTLADIYTIPDRLGYIDITELEQVYVSNGDFYLAFNPVTFTSVVPTVVKCNPSAKEIYLQQPSTKRQFSVNVDSETGSEIIYATMLYSGRITFKFIEDAINFANGARIVINFYNKYDYSCSLRNVNVDLYFRNGCIVNGAFEFTASTVAIESENDASFANQKASNANIYSGQSAQFRFSFTNVRISSLPIYEYTNHLYTYSEFIFLFNECDVYCEVGKISGFIMRKSSLKITGNILGGYVIIENSHVNCNRIYADTNEVCFVAPNTSLYTVYYYNNNDLHISIDKGQTQLLPYYLACHLQADDRARGSFSICPVVNNTGADTDVRAGLIGIESSGNAACLLSLRNISEPWPKQLTNSSIVLYGLNLTFTENYKMDGTISARTTYSLRYAR